MSHKNPYIRKIEVYKSINDASFLFRQYHRNGKVKTEYAHLNGVLIDTVFDYFPSGKIKAKTHYVDGKLDGYQHYYFENGKPESIQLFKSDTIILSDYKEFDSLGREINKFSYENGVKKFTEYNDDGNLYKTCDVMNERFHGTCFTYKENKEVDTKICYTNGKLDSSKCVPYYSDKLLGPEDYYMKALKKKEGILYGIYGRHLEITEFEGTIRFLYRINSRGEVEYIIHTHDSTNNPKFVNDVIKYISIMEFEPYQKHRNVIVSQKFNFSITNNWW